jgi:hypothetical protein
MKEVKMALWNRMRERVGWERDDDRDRGRVSGDWRGEARDDDRGYGQRWGSGDYRASYDRDRSNEEDWDRSNEW